MTRVRRIATRDRFFFVTTNLARTQRKLDGHECDIVMAALNAQRAQSAFWLFAYVIMPDHIHLLLRPWKLDLTSVMTKFKGAAGTRILSGRKIQDPLWQPRYFDNIIRHVRDFWKKVEYIHNNPVEARMVARPGDWRWSSYAAYFKGGAPSPVPVDPVDLPADGDAMLWNP